MIYEWVIFLLVYWGVFSEMDNRKYILNTPNSRWKNGNHPVLHKWKQKNMKKKHPKKM
jgi:hypothetical protein